MSQVARPYRKLLVVVFLAAIGLRMGVTARFQGLSSPPNLSANPDAGEYERIAYHLSAGHGYAFGEGRPTASRPPGTPLTILPVYLIFGRSFLAAHLWMILLSSATCLITAWLATQYGGAPLGLLAASWLAIYPGHFYYSMHFLSETVYGFWLALACALTLRSLTRESRSGDAAAGIAWGLAILTRVEMVLSVPMAWVLLLAASGDIGRRLRRPLARQTAVAMLLVLLWVARNVVSMGVPTLSTQRGFAFWGAHNNVTFSDSSYAGSWLAIYQRTPNTQPVRGTEVEKDKLTFGYGVAAVREHVSSLPYLMVMKLWRLASPFFDTTNRAVLWALALGWIATAPFVGWGAIVMLSRRFPERWRVLVIAVPLAATVVMAAAFYGAPRFRDALAPLFLVVAATGAVDLIKRARYRRAIQFRPGSPGSRRVKSAIRQAWLLPRGRE